MSLPLKSGGRLPLSWMQTGVIAPYNNSCIDGTWPAGQHARFTFYPAVSYQGADPIASMELWAEGLTTYNLAGDPNEENPRYIKVNSPYYTTYDAMLGTYYEYWDNSVALSQAGRLNRSYDRYGNELLYPGEPATTVIGGTWLWNAIGGDVGRAVPYFEWFLDGYNYHSAVSKMHLADLDDPAESRTVYFTYSNQFGAAMLDGIIYPEGCAQLYYSFVWADAGLANSTPGREVDPEGYTTYFVVDANTQIARTIEPEGRIVYYDWIANPLETRKTPLGRPTTYYFYQRSSAIDTAVMINCIVDAVGNISYWNYDATLSRPTGAVDPRGNLAYFQYVGGGTPLQYGQTLAMRVPSAAGGAGAGAINRYGYGGGGSPANLYAPSAQTGPRNVPGSFPVVTYFEFNAAGARTSYLDPVQGRTRWAYDSLGRYTATQNARGYTTYFNYGQATGHRDSVVHPDGSIAYYGYNSFRDLTRDVSPRYREQSFAAFTTYYTYDRRGRRRKKIDPLGNVTYFDWTSRSDLLAEVDPAGTTTTYTYNGLRLLTQEVTTDLYGTVLTQNQYGTDIYKNRIRKLNTRGYATYYFYDAIDRPIAQKDALGNTTYLFYDRSSNLTVTRDPRGNSAYFFYDYLSRQTSKRDALGSSVYYFYDEADNNTHITTTRGFTTYYFYDAANRTTIMLDPLAGAVYFGYDANHNRTAILDPRGNAVYFFYDSRDRQSGVRDAQGNLTYYFYDAAGNRTHIVDPRRSATYFFFDTMDRLKVSRDAVGNATYYFYDSVGDGSVVRNARGGVTYYSFDALQRMTLAQDPVGGYTAWSYDGQGNLTDMQTGLYAQRPGYGLQPYGTTPYGGSGTVNAKYFYDGVDRLQISLDTLANPTYYFYDASSNRTQVRDARGNTTYFFFDALNRPNSLRNMLGHQSYFFYDQASNRVAVRNPNLHGTYFGYDAWERMIRVQDALGGTVYFDYDASGNLVKVFDPDLHAVQARYDTLNRPDAVRMPDTGSAYFVYDASSNRIREVDPRGNPTYYLYDALNRVTGIQDALFRVLYFEYDQTNNLSRYMDAEGATSAHTYDLANRRTNTLYTIAGSIVSASLRSDPYYVYDLKGNITQMGDLWGLHRMGYDLNGRPTVHRYPNGSNVYYEYDSVSNLITKVYPGSAGKAGSGYDEANRQIRVQAPSGATAYFAYDAASNLTQRFLGNSAKIDVSYDAAERISRWRASDKNNAPLTYFDYTRDAKGLITKVVREATHTIYYSYDASDRLLSEIWAKTGATPSEVYGYRYAYDVAGNRTKAKVNGTDTYYFYDQANQLTVTGGTSAYATPSYYIYDRNGSLTNLVEPTGATYFAYNAAGLTARIKWRDASATYFFYDGNLGRYGMNHLGVSTYFLWEGPDLLQELNADGTTKEEYTNARTPIAGIGQLIEINRPGQTPQKLYPIQDPRGTVIKLIQSDGTAVQAAREYEAFGNLIPNSTIGSYIGRFSYQGQTWLELGSADASNRLLISPTRIYSPAIGRFLQNELLPNKRSNLHYLYQPVNGVDPNGMEWIPLKDRFRRHIRREFMGRLLGETLAFLIVDAQCESCACNSNEKCRHSNEEQCYRATKPVFNVTTEVHIATWNYERSWLGLGDEPNGESKIEFMRTWENIIKTWSHEYKHVMAFVLWHDQNERKAKSELITECRFKTRSDCSRYVDDIRRSYKQAFDMLTENESKHAGLNWEGTPGNLNVELSPDQQRILKGIGDAGMFGPS